MPETDNLTTEGLYAIISASRYRDVNLLAPPEFIAAVHELALRMDLRTQPPIFPQGPERYVWGQPVTAVYDGSENVKFVDGHWKLAHGAGTGES
jgi:hypothetical protein